MRRTALLALALLSALSFSAHGDDPKVVIAPVESVAPGDIVEIDASASTGDAFQWLPLSGKRCIPGESGKRAYFATGTPGKYEFALIAAGATNGKAALATGRVTVEVTGPAPPAPTPIPPVPPPNPPAPPTPVPPAPVSGTLNVSLVVDLDALTPDIAAVRTGLRAREAFKGLDAVYRTYATAAADLNRLNLAPIVAKIGAPCLIVQDSAGHVLFAERAPNTEDALIARIAAVRGK